MEIEETWEIGVDPVSLRPDEESGPGKGGIHHLDVTPEWRIPT